MKTQNDSLLVQKYLAGDESALARLINKYNGQIFGFIYSNVKNYDVTNDIFQDAFIKVILALKKGRYKEEQKFLPWVTRIAHNAIIDHYRAQKRRAIREYSDDFDMLSLIPCEQLDAECSHVKDETSSKLRAMIDQLPPEQQEVVNMRIFGKMGYNEIAEEKNISINTSLGRMRYALINLRKLVDQHNMELL